MCQSFQTHYIGEKMINGKELVPVENNGLEDYKFVMPFHGAIFVYHKTEHKTPLHGRIVTDWLCCTEGWHLKADGKWHETIYCGWKPDRVVDTIEDIFNLYRNQ